MIGQRKRIHTWTVALASVIASALAATGCASTPDWMDGVTGLETGTVVIREAKADQPQITYRVKSSGRQGPTAEGVKLLNLEEPGPAAEAFERAITEDPEDANAYFLAGLTAELNGQRSRAASYYRKAYVLRSDPRYAESYRRVK